MALSVFQDPQGVDWPLGFIPVATIGTPVNIMSLVDANNTNNPNTPVGPGTAGGAEYPPRCHKLVFHGLKPGANNNGFVYNTGNVYILRAPGPAPGNNNSGGPGNRSDAGALVGIVTPGGSYTIIPNELDSSTINPYRYTLDADANNEGALVTAFGCTR